MQKLAVCVCIFSLCHAYMMSLQNSCAELKFHIQSLRGTVQDYCINFNEEQSDMTTVVEQTLDLFQSLMKDFKDKTVSARLVAKVNFVHVNQETNEMDERSYHFPSFSSEKVVDVKEFYERHMNKIAYRLEEFNRSGSNLMIKNIAHIHILLTVLKK